MRKGESVERERGGTVRGDTASPYSRPVQYGTAHNSPYTPKETSRFNFEQIDKNGDICISQETPLKMAGQRPCHSDFGNIESGCVDEALDARIHIADRNETIYV